jgi:hypothetical protein
MRGYAESCPVKIIASIENAEVIEKILGLFPHSTQLF